MGIHLLYIPLLPRSAIFNKSNFYFYWLQYTQYLRTDLITKGLLGNLLPPTFHGNETPGKLFCILFSSSFQTRLLAPTWDLRLVKFPPHYSQLCALSQVSADLKGNGCLNWNPHSNQRAANSKPSSWRCLESFIQILFKSKICLLWKYILSDDIRGPKSNPVSWSSPHQFDYIHPNVGTQWFNFNVKIQSPDTRALTWYRDQIDLSLITLISQIASQ